MAMNKRQKAILAATVPGKAYAIDEAQKILKDTSKADKAKIETFRAKLIAHPEKFIA